MSAENAILNCPNIDTSITPRISGRRKLQALKCGAAPASSALGNCGFGGEYEK